MEGRYSNTETHPRSNAETGEFDKLDLLYWFDWESFNKARAYIKRGCGRRVRKVAKFMG